MIWSMGKKIEGGGRGTIFERGEKRRSLKIRGKKCNQKRGQWADD
jgi:hypothetical protein